MRAPKSEWMLWAKKLKDEYAVVQRRVQALELECSELRQSNASRTTVGEPAAANHENSMNGRHSATNAVDKVTAGAAVGSSDGGFTQQGAQSLEQYLDGAQSKHTQLETDLVGNFLAGMNDGPDRASLEACLNERGHTWSNLETHMQTLIHGGPLRCCRVRRYLMR